MATSPRAPAEGAPGSVDRVIAGPGTPLETELRRDMEQRFGRDFSRVRVHADGNAARSARDLHARAYTVGNDIVFGAGQLQPAAPQGLRLLAHELTHTLQQDASRPSAAPGSSARLVQRDGAFDVPTLDQSYASALEAARQTGDWTRAAELLNGFSHEDIQNRLARLSDNEVSDLHAGAVANPRVGPDAQVALLTAPGAKRASTPPIAASAQPTPARQPPPEGGGARQVDATATMSAVDKVVAAYGRAKLAPALREKLESFVTPEALALAIVAFVVVFVASQFTPVGWAADIGIALTAVFIASALFSAIKHLIGFAAARNATTSDDLDRAGAEFAAAVAEITIDTLVFLVTHKLGGGGRGGAPLEGPPPTQLRLGLTQEGFLFPVVAETVPATLVQSAAAAGLGGVKAAAATNSLMSAMSGPGGPSDRATSSGSRGSGPPAAGSRQVEQTFIERLKDRYPKLRQLDIRPRARPAAGKYTSKTESAEVGGTPEYRSEVTGAPEHAFEERMQTSQGKYSYNVYRDGKVVFEIDGISVDGWLEEVKIQQNMGKIDNILAQLRVQADFAEAYGLKGVRYSIAPPEVAAEVESRVAQERLTNVFRAE